MPIKSNDSSVSLPDTSFTTVSLAGGRDFEGLWRLNYQSVHDQIEDWALIKKVSTSTCWVVDLHGHGGTGTQLYTRKDTSENWIPVFDQYGCNVVTPNLRGNAWMGPAAVADLHVLLDYLRVHHRAERFIFVGGSMGGTSCLIYAVCHPQDVSAVVAMCPATNVAGYGLWCRQRQASNATIREIADAIDASYSYSPQACLKHNVVENAQQLTMPVAMAHGDADAVIPVEQSRCLASKLTRHPKFRYDELPGGSHETPLLSLRSLFEFVL